MIYAGAGEKIKQITLDYATSRLKSVSPVFRGLDHGSALEATGGGRDLTTASGFS